MSRTKKIALVIGALVVLVVGGSFVYATFLNKADAPLSQNDVNQRLDGTTTTAPSTAVPGTTAPAGSAPATTTPAATTTPGTGPAPTGDVAGAWKISSGSEVGYRVKESINGFDTTANGRTQAITGDLTLKGTSATAATFTVDMTTFHSDESRRDGQFNGRVMQVDQFPTSTFALTAPIDFGKVPTDGKPISVKATGDLTLHGVKKSVTFPLSATFKNGRIGILGQIPVVFADYSITNPSFATVTTEDHGLLEFVLILDRA
jgi:polyisoprenoid-binding protein YceI